MSDALNSELAGLGASTDRRWGHRQPCCPALELMTASPPRPANEADRLRRLHALAVLDSGSEPLFDELARAAARVAGTPIALLSLIDGERQWFKANIGLEGCSGTPRDVTFCAHAILDDAVFSVPDARVDPRFAANPLVTGDPAIRFYAGAPIRLGEGLAMGTLCVIDQQPRRLAAEQVEILQLLARVAGHALEQRLAALQREAALQSEARLQRAAVEDRARLAATLDATGAGCWEWDTRSGELQVDARWSAQLGGSIDWRSPHPIETWQARVHPDDRAGVFDAVRWHLRGQTESAECEYRIRHDDGHWVWMQACGRAAVRDADGRAQKLFGIQRDVSARRLDEQRLRASEAFLDRTGRVAGVGGWEVDLDSGRITWSTQTCRLHGVAPGHRPTLGEALAYYPPASRVVLQTAMDQAIATSSGWDLEVAFTSPIRGPLWVRVVGAVERIDGRAVRLIGAFHDISERRALQLRSAESDRLLRRVADSVPSRIAYVDRSLRYRFVNAAQCERFGCYRDQVIGRTWEELTGEAAEARVLAAVEQVLTGLPQRYELVEPGPEGPRTIDCQLVPDQLADGAVPGFFCTGIDITHLKSVERELARRSELMRVTLQSIAEAVITTDSRGLVQWCNPVAERMTGWRDGEAVGRPLAEVFAIVDQDSRLPAGDPVAICLQRRPAEGSAGNLALVGRDGIEHAIEESTAPIRDADGGVIGAVLVFHDVGAQRRFSREMSRRARQDALTGLMNRGEFDLQLSRLVAGLRLERGVHALLYIDLDRFKAVNDACGHAAGDQLLRQVAELLVDTVRRRDRVARLGGDEFAVILEHCGTEVARQVAQKISDRFDAFDFSHDGRHFKIGASIGLLPLDARWSDAASVLNAADAACISAKAAGRNRVLEWSNADRSLAHGAAAAAGWASRLERALANGHFQLDAQRIAPLREAGHDGGVRAELLPRLCDVPDGPPIVPAVFMVAAERFDIAGRIDRWMAARAIDWLRRHPPPSGANDLTIRLSGASVADPHFHRYVAALIDAADIDPRQLCLAIDEAVALQRSTDAAEWLGRLRALGLRTALDGFGAGGLSFAHLKGLPLDLLRIDARFAAQLDTEPLQAVALRSIAQAAQVLGLRTVATGVASAAAWQALRALDIDLAQGTALQDVEPLDPLLPPPAQARRGIAAVTGER